MARGGRRVGAGRKPKPRDGMGRIITHPSAPFVTPSTNGPIEVEEFDAPDSLSAEARAVWLKQSPHAFRNGTLKRSTAMSFERYCEIAVLERNEAKSSGVGGANHRGLMKEVRALEMQFMLTPAGKPIVEPVSQVAAVDDDDAFFGAPRAGGR